MSRGPRRLPEGDEPGAVCFSPGCPPPDGLPAARVRILRAAERLFAEKGYDGTSVHEITDAASVNRALLYYYFEDKHSLYATVIDEGIADFIAMQDQALAQPGSHADRLAAFVCGHLALLWKREQLCRVMHRCLLDGHQEEFGLRERFRCGLERLVEFFRQAVESGEFRPVDPEIAARTCLGPTFVLTMWRMTDGDRYSQEELSEHVVRQALSAFLAR